MPWRFGAGFDPSGLVVPGGVDGEFADEFCGGGVDDADFEVLDEHQDAGPGAGSSDADVVQTSGEVRSVNLLNP
jgi:hypothetical protein